MEPKRQLEDDSIFLRELKIGHQWQLWVGLQFLEEGFVVQVPQLRVRPDHDEIGNYTDHGDVMVFVRKRPRRFECKSRALTFTCVEDYPFDTAFVDRVNTWKRKESRKPAAVLLVSRVTGAILVVPVSTEKEWAEQESFDSIRNYERNYYIVDKSKLRDWADLIAWLRELEIQGGNNAGERLRI